MVRRLICFIVVAACVIAFSAAGDVNKELYKITVANTAPQNERPRGSIDWPAENLKEKFPVFECGIDSAEMTESAFVIKAKVVSFDEYLTYINKFAALGIGENTFNENIVPLVCIYFAKSADYNAKIIYYSDENMPEYNMVISVGL